MAVSCRLRSSMLDLLLLTFQHSPMLTVQRFCTQLCEWEQYLAAAPSHWLSRGASEKCITSLVQVGQDHSTILLSTHS